MFALRTRSIIFLLSLLYLHLYYYIVTYSYTAPQNVRMNEPKDELIAQSNVNLIFYKNLY